MPFVCCFVQNSINQIKEDIDFNESTLVTISVKDSGEHLRVYGILTAESKEGSLFLLFFNTFARMHLVFLVNTLSKMVPSQSSLIIALNKVRFKEFLGVRKLNLSFKFGEA